MSTNTHLIIYQPGYGGNLLGYLFSLNPTTKSLLSINNPGIDRSELYSFNHSKKFVDWPDFHTNYSDMNRETTDFSQDTNQQLVIVLHPTEYQQYRHMYLDNMNVIFYIAALARCAFSDYWLMKSKENWNGYPFLRRQEIVQEEYINNTYNPMTISIDLFLDPLTWQDEYLRINKLMNLIPDLTVATKLYQDWYKLRVAPLRKEFDILSTAQINIYSEQRDKMEAYSRTWHEIVWSKESEIHYNILVDRSKSSAIWRNFYSQVGGPTWPACQFERDFYKLPDRIQQELISKFNYKPIII
jgi:hypothetical protein